MCNFPWEGKGSVGEGGAWGESINVPHLKHTHDYDTRSQVVALSTHVHAVQCSTHTRARGERAVLIRSPSSERGLAPRSAAKEANAGVRCGRANR